MRRLSLRYGSGSGNAFYILENEDCSDAEVVSLARALHRPPAPMPQSDGLLWCTRAPYQMRMVNPDGSRALMCGNGLRLAARLFFADNTEAGERLAIHTDGGVLHATHHAGFFKQYGGQPYTAIDAYGVEIGPIVWDDRQCTLAPFFDQPITTLPALVEESLCAALNDARLSYVAVPNPHLVVLTETLPIEATKALAIPLGAQLNANHPAFPDGVNVTIAVQLDKARLYTTTYERGVGLTHACGTAMSASALVAAQSRKDAPARMQVLNAGGMVVCELPSREHPFIRLMGDASFLATAEITWHGADTANSLECINFMDDANETKNAEKIRTLGAAVANTSH